MIPLSGITLSGDLNSIQYITEITEVTNRSVSTLTVSSVETFEKTFFWFIIKTTQVIVEENLFILTK
jgi:hypothetical protein